MPEAPFSPEASFSPEALFDPAAGVAADSPTTIFDQLGRTVPATVTPEPPAPDRTAARYAAVQASPEFVVLRRRQRRFAFPAAALALGCYLSYALLVAFVPGPLGHRLTGEITVALGLAMLQLAAAVAFTLGYLRYARTRLDPLAATVRAAATSALTTADVETDPFEKETDQIGPHEAAPHKTAPHKTAPHEAVPRMTATRETATDETSAYRATTREAVTRDWAVLATASAETAART